MEPFHFLSGEDRLFGVYHPAQDVFSQKAVLLCPPIYAEYFRTYRYLRRLADAWSQSGYHVLRFDYYGTGDSSGDWQDGGPARWIQDIQAAFNELQDISGCTNVSLAGVRFGATLALMTTPKVGAVDKLMAWDPICDGGEYLDALQVTHGRLLAKLDPSTRSRLAALPNELAGFPRVGWLDESLAKISVADLAPDNLREVRYIASHADFVDSRLTNALRESGVNCNETVVEDDCDWGTPSENSLQAFTLLEELKTCL